MTCLCRHGEAELYLQPIRNFGARWESVVSTTPRLLYLRETPGTHCTGGRVGLGGGVDGHGNFRLPPGFDPRTVQPVKESLYRRRYAVRLGPVVLLHTAGSYDSTSPFTNVKGLVES